MACNCQPKGQWVVTRADGSTAPYPTESQAAADVRRNGGSYRFVAG